MTKEQRQRVLEILEQIKKDTETIGYDRGIVGVPELVQEAILLVEIDLEDNPFREDRPDDRLPINNEELIARRRAIGLKKLGLD